MPSDLDSLDPRGKRVLLRADLNVPVKDGRITDRTRIERLSPTIRELAGKGARVIVLQPFRPAEGQARAGDVAGADGGSAGGSARPRGRLRRRLRRAEAEAAAVAMRDGDVICWRTPASTPARRRTTRACRGAGQAGRCLRQRRLLRRPSRACQHRGRGAPAARPMPGG